MNTKESKGHQSLHVNLNWGAVLTLEMAEVGVGGAWDERGKEIQAMRSLSFSQSSFSQCTWD